MPMPINYQTAEEFTAEQAAAMVRRYAIVCGRDPELAAVELLIRHDLWLGKSPFRRAIAVHEEDGLTYGQIQWGYIPAALRDPQLLGSALRGSTSEIKILRIAVMLADGDTSCGAADLFTNLGHHHIALVMRAIGAANGNRWNAQVWVGKVPPEARVDTPSIWDAPDIPDRYADTFKNQLWPGGPQK